MAQALFFCISLQQTNQKEISQQPRSYRHPQAPTLGRLSTASNPSPGAPLRSNCTLNSAWEDGIRRCPKAPRLNKRQWVGGAKTTKSGPGPSCVPFEIIVFSDVFWTVLEHFIGWIAEEFHWMLWWPGCFGGASLFAPCDGIGPSCCFWLGRMM